MEHANENLEYSVRFGLKHSFDNIDKAAKIALAKYRSIVKRQVRPHETMELKSLMHELHLFQLESQFKRSLVSVG